MRRWPLGFFKLPFTDKIIGDLVSRIALAPMKASIFVPKTQVMQRKTIVLVIKTQSVKTTTRIFSGQADLIKTKREFVAEIQTILDPKQHQKETEILVGISEIFER